MPFQFNPFTGNLDLTGSGGSGNVVAPLGGSTDNAVVRFDGTTGKQLQDSLVTIDDAGNINTPGGIVSDNLDVDDITAHTIETTGDVQFGGTINTPLTHNRAAIIDNSGNIAASSVTSTELGYSSGVTSAIQTQLDAKIPLTQKAAANGVATLDGGGKIPAAQLPSTVMSYLGTWNAATNTPTLADGTGDAGDVYLTDTAGTVNFGSGAITFAVGDWAVYSGSIWQKSINSNAVVSVNAKSGIVILDTGDIAENGNLYYTDERAQDGIGTILADTASIDFTYSDSTPSISAVVLPAGVDHNSLQNYVANQHVDHTTVQIATAAATSGLSGGGTIAATRNLAVDIHGTTAKTTPVAADELLIWDVAGSANKRVTRANLLNGYSVSSAGDLSEGAFALSNNQSAAADVTGFNFSNAVVRGFEAIVTVYIDATTDLFEEFRIKAIQKGALWEPAIVSVGDDSGVTFSITTSGQVQYTSSNYTGFSSGTVKFRAETLSV